MALASSLLSRLKVLVAKTYRAEKLYGSIRNTHSALESSVESMSQLANDLRAVEWQKSHAQLRVALNDLVSGDRSRPLSESVRELEKTFRARADSSDVVLLQGTNNLVDSAKRYEFAHVLKLATELIRLRARVQANSAIADELMGLQDSAGGVSVGEQSLDPEELAEAFAASEAEAEPSPVAEPSLSNVIPFARRAAGGK